MKLDEVNKDNLLQGKDGEGRDMPFYAPGEYGFEKFRSNTRNRGRWDLKLTGQYHRNISIRYIGNYITLYQRLNNSKVDWIDRRLESFNLHPLGLPQNELNKLMEKRIPLLKRKIEKYIQNV